MITRTITWTVGDDLKAAPTALQDAGIQGEHEATEVVFRLPDRVKDYNLYLEYLGGDGLWDTTAALPYDAELGGLSFLLPRAWTRGGGAATLRLVLEQPAADVLQPPVRYTVPVRIRYADREVECGEEKRFLEQNVHRILSAGERAVRSAAEAESAQEFAEGAAVTAEEAAKKAWGHELNAGRWADTAHAAKEEALAAMAAAKEANEAAKEAQDAADVSEKGAKDASAVARQANEAAGNAASQANTAMMQAQEAAKTAVIAESGSKAAQKSAEDSATVAASYANIAENNRLAAEEARSKAEDAAERAENAGGGGGGGKDGIAPNIGENGNWFIGDVDTGVKAGGRDGYTPYIGANGNWFINLIDTGVKAVAEDGAYYIPNVSQNAKNLVFTFTSSKEGMPAYKFEFPTPKDGTSVTIKSIGENTEDGSHVVTFSDGKTLTVKDGKDGLSFIQARTTDIPTTAGSYGTISVLDLALINRTPAVGDTVVGANGYLGTVNLVSAIEVRVSALGVSIRGNDGETGRGIAGIARTSGTGAPGTTDTYTIAYTDKTTSTFTLYNGKDGKTPVKGEDYYTPEDKAEIVSELADAAPVRSVNGKTGAVMLSADDVGARPASWTPTYIEVGADKSGTAGTAVYSHNTQTEAHSDIRLLISELSARLDALANSDDDTLDQMAEVVAYIKDNRGLIEQITTGKVSVADIVNNLTTNVTDKPLSAAQGVALKALIDAITVPTKVSAFTNDAGYITGYTETDPTVPAWAKAASKPSYSKSEVGLGNVDNVKQYSASNPPPYPVTSVNGKTGAVTLDAAAVSARPNTWTPSAADVGAVPTSRTVNGKALSGNISLSASDVGALPSSTTIPSKTSQLTNDSNFAVTTKAETWTFTLEDGNIVTKKVVLA